MNAIAFARLAHYGHTARVGFQIKDHKPHVHSVEMNYTGFMLASRGLFNIQQDQPLSPGFVEDVRSRLGRI